jgi:hypothetical protein
VVVAGFDGADADGVTEVQVPGGHPPDLDDVEPKVEGRSLAGRLQLQRQVRFAENFACLFGIVPARNSVTGKQLTGQCGAGRSDHGHGVETSGSWVERDETCH